MSLITTLALVAIVLTALYLLALGATSLLAPERARRFLLGFAGSPSVHFSELSLRLVVGAAFVQYAPHVRLPAAFQILGWVILITTLCLLVVPWSWHRRFAQLTVPSATRYISVIGLASLSCGGLILFAVLRGNPV